MNIKMKKGFTLIELLVVIAILGILATVTVVSFNGAQARARDAQRKANLEKIASALEMYRSVNKKYPCTNATCDGTSFVDFSIVYQNVIPKIDVYLPQNPSANPQTADKYYYYSNGVDFKVVSLKSESLENTVDAPGAKKIAGDYYDGANPVAPNNFRTSVPDDIKTSPWKHFQVSSSSVAANW